MVMTRRHLLVLPHTNDRMSQVFADPAVWNFLMVRARQQVSTQLGAQCDLLVLTCQHISYECDSLVLSPRTSIDIIMGARLSA